MSTGFDILFSPGAAFPSQPISVYLEILKLVLDASGVRRPEVNLTIYREQRPFDYGTGSKDHRIVFDGKLHEEKAVEKLAQLIGGEARDLYIGVTCEYDLLRWDNESCDHEKSGGPFTLEYESPGFDGGHAFKMRGPYRIHFFDNKRVFTPGVVDLSRCPANPALLAKLIEYGRNIKFVENLFREIAAALRPSYLFVVAEGEPVSPLNFLMVYHSKLSGYVFDAQKILQMHAVGGGYFYEGRCYEVDVPYNSLAAPYENDLRSAEDAARLTAQLDHFCSVLGNSNLNEIRLSDEEIYDLISSSSIANPEPISDSILLTRSFRGYLDDPYLKLLDWEVG